MGLSLRWPLFIFHWVHAHCDECDFQVQYVPVGAICLFFRPIYHLTDSVGPWYRFSRCSIIDRLQYFNTIEDPVLLFQNVIVSSRGTLRWSKSDFSLQDRFQLKPPLVSIFGLNIWWIHIFLESWSLMTDDNAPNEFQMLMTPKC